MLHIKPYNRLHCTHRTCDSISFIDSGLRLSSTGCLSDSLCEAGRRAASSPAYMKPLEVNFLIKAPHHHHHHPPIHPRLPETPAVVWADVCVCTSWHACLCMSMWVVRACCFFALCVHMWINAYDCVCVWECTCAMCLCTCMRCGWIPACVQCGWLHMFEAVLVHVSASFSTCFLAFLDFMIFVLSISYIVLFSASLL